MATSPGTVEALVEQGSAAGPLRAKRMFGEYALYHGGTLVALVCDDRLFVKPTQAGRDYLGEAEEVPPYPGAKPSLLVPGERWEDADWLSELFRLTAAALPSPKAKARPLKARRP